MIDQWNRAQEGHRRQAHVPWNQYHGIDKVFSSTLPPAAIPSSVLSTISGMNTGNDTSLSPLLHTPLPSFLPQQLVWPTIESSMTMNPSSFYFTSMADIASKPPFFIPMPIYDCAYPNISSNSNSISNIDVAAAARATATTSGAYIMTQPPILPPQLGLANTETLQTQPAMHSSMLRSSSSNNAFPTRFDDDKEDPYHSSLCQKTSHHDNTFKHDTSLFEKDDSFLLPPACKISSQSRSVNHEPLDSSPDEGPNAATATSYHCFEKAAATENEEHPSPSSSSAAAAGENVLLSKPKRALSAYNLFFKDQRERMIRLLEEKEEEEENQGRTQNAQYRSLQNGRGGERRRPRRHGIRFESMAREIAQLWKNVDPQVLSQFQAAAEKDKERYQDEKKMYLQQRMNVMETTREQLEATVSDHVRQNYLEKAACANSSEGNASKKKKRKRVE